VKYLCLAYYDEQKFEALAKDEFAAIAAQCPQHDDALKASGRLMAHGSLGLSSTSTSLRPRGGSIALTDGPFVETKEQVGGFFLIEARDLNEAIQVASKHPAAHLGEHVGWGIEVRPVEFFESFGEALRN
jgi:hypothetical protein